MNTDSNSQAKLKSLSKISFQPDVDIIDDGYALCDKQSLSLVYCNPVFRKWFNIHELHVAIDQIIDTLRADILLKTLG